jgi:hypothetical protein
LAGIAWAGDIFLAKMSKTQQLARKDLEMLEQYVAGQQDQSEHVQATICPQPEQPEQDSADLNFSEPKTLLHTKGDTNVVKTSPLLSLDKSIKVYQDQGDLQRHAAKTVLDQVFEHASMLVVDVTCYAFMLARCCRSPRKIGVGQKPRNVCLIRVFATVLCIAVDCKAVRFCH